MRMPEAGFQVLTAERTAGTGKLKAKATIRTGVVAEMRVVVFEGSKGVFASVDGGRDGSGGYVRPVRFERDVSDAIANAILDRLESLGSRSPEWPSDESETKSGTFDRF